MSARVELPRPVALLPAAGGAVLLAAGLSAASWLVGPVFLALVVVIVVHPVHGRIRRLGLPGWVATLTLVLAVYGLLVALSAVLVVSVARLATVLPAYAAEANALLGAAVAQAAEFGVGADQLRALTSTLDAGRLVSLAGGLLLGVTGLAGNLIFVLSLLLFLGVESATASTRLAGVEAERPAMAEALRRFAHGTRRFLVVTTAIGLITGLVDYVILSVMGVPLALLWGLLVFITNYIPYVGFWIGLAPPFLLALLAGGVSRALVVLGVFVVVNFVLTSLIQPKIVGDAVGLSVSLTLVALVFWAWLLGPLGAVLAVPLTLLAKQVLVDANPRVRWLNFLVGGAPPTTAGALAPSPDPSPPDHTASADHPPDADTASPGEDVPTATSGPPTSRDDGP